MMIYTKAVTTFFSSSNIEVLGKWIRDCNFYSIKSYLKK